jgi:hypothetical protein
LLQRHLAVLNSDASEAQTQMNAPFGAMTMGHPDQIRPPIVICSTSTGCRPYKPGIGGNPSHLRDNPENEISHMDKWNPGIESLPLMMMSWPPSRDYWLMRVQSDSIGVLMSINQHKI